MKAVLFDLGRTLEFNDVLLPGAREALEGISSIRDAAGGPAAAVALVSDSAMPADAAQIPAIRREYGDLLTALGIIDLFEPLAERLTVSAEVGVRKPDARIFGTAIRKIDPSLTFRDAIFITESLEHVRAARRLGMRAVHFRGPGEAVGEVVQLADLVPLVRDFLLGSPARAGGKGARRSQSGELTAVAVYNFASGVRARGTWPAAAPNVAWAQFGNQFLAIGPREELESAAGAARELGLSRGEGPFELQRESLHLVVQNGRLFQQEQPDIPVILDRGRFLAVEIDPERARRLDAENVTCFAVRPLEDNQIVFEELRAESAREAPQQRIIDLVSQLSRASFEAAVRRLASLPTRLSSSTQFLAAAEQSRLELESLGYAARVESVALGGGAQSRSVIADKQGSGPGARRVVIVCAHLDSINSEGPLAPGADDNASGSAGLLEMARVFRDHRGAHDLRLILFGGEEQGLLGSRQYVAGLSAAERARIGAVVNMDMIAARNPDERGAPVPPGVLLEGAPVSRDVVERLAAAAAAHTRLSVARSFVAANSDHVPFVRAGIPAVLTIEAADGRNIHIHSGRDTADRLDFDLGLEILRMNTGFVAAELGDPA